MKHECIGGFNSKRFIVTSGGDGDICLSDHNELIFRNKGKI